MQAQAVVERCFAAVEARDLPALLACFAADATYQNVPYPAAVGHDAIGAMFTRILERSERVEWQVRSAAYVPGRAHVERLDCFWIDGTLYSVPCHCVAEVDEEAGVITAFRDYVDLGRWRDTIGDALTR